MDPQFNKLAPSRYGLFVYNVNDRYVGKSYDAYGEWKENEVKLFRNFVRDGMVVLDIGANIGQHTLFFAQTVGHQGSVLAFEPQRLFYQTMCANMALNHVAKAYCHNVAVGEKSGKIDVPVRVPWLKDFNFSALPLQGVTYDNCEPIDMICIDQLNLSKCHFMKIEVVGMELAVLKGATDTIRRLRPVLYVENDTIGYLTDEKKNVVREDNKERSRNLIGYLDALKGITRCTSIPTTSSKTRKTCLETWRP